MKASPLTLFLTRKGEEYISEGHPQSPGDPDSSGLHTPFFCNLLEYLGPQFLHRIVQPNYASHVEMMGEEYISEGHPQSPGDPDASGLHTPFFCNLLEYLGSQILRRTVQPNYASHVEVKVGFSCQGGVTVLRGGAVSYIKATTIAPLMNITTAVK